MYHQQILNKPSRFICLFLLTLLIIQTNAQDETRIRSVIDPSDLKELEKAEDYKAKADALIGEANQYYQEILNVQVNTEYSEKQIEKKIAKLESSAQKKQEQASSYYDKCHELKFIVYQDYIDQFWSSFEGDDSKYDNVRLIEEQADEYYFQALNYRVDAKSMQRGPAKIEMLTKANDLENQAIDKQITALGIYYGFDVEEVPSETTTQMQEMPADQTPEVAKPAVSDQQQTRQFESTLPEDIVINQDIIDMYNRYIESGQYADTSYLRGEMTDITEFDREQILELWYRYRYGEELPLPPDLQATAADSVETVAAEGELAQQAETAYQEEAEEPEAVEIGVVTDEDHARIVPADEEVIYRVQISANRTELSQRTLSRIYYGNKRVDMILEEGWYKYSVGDFDTFEEANEFRRSSGVDNAFIVAYRKGTRFIPVAEEVSSAITETALAEGQAGMPAGLLFRIQIAANHVPFSIQQINSIYNGNYSIEVIQEDGWYKYQFLGVRLYADALNIVRDVQVKGVFIVAYKDGVRQDLHQSILNNRALEKTVQTYGRKGNINEIEFHVQIAASRSPIRTANIQNIYKGSDPVSVILEEGWYKYRIKTGNSYDKALKIKQECGVDQAFIIAYKRAEKITLNQALQEIK